MVLTAVSKQEIRKQSTHRLEDVTAIRSDKPTDLSIFKMKCSLSVNLERISCSRGSSVAAAFALTWNHKEATRRKQAVSFNVLLFWVPLKTRQGEVNNIYDLAHINWLSQRRLQVAVILYRKLT